MLVWGKEKMLITRYFLLSYMVFYTFQNEFQLFSEYFYAAIGMGCIDFALSVCLHKTLTLTITFEW